MAESTVHIGKKELYFQLIGHLRGERTVVVLLHEALGSVGQWKNFPAAVHETLGLPVIVPERSGHGKSSPAENVKTERYLHEYTVETHEFLQSVLGADQRVILIGHSDGGTIALLLAKHFPARIDKIVTIAAHTFVEPQTVAGIGPAVKAWEQGKLAGLTKYHGCKTEKLFFSWADTWRSEFFSNWDIRKEIRGTGIPVLALQGDRDQYGTVLQLESIAEAAIHCRIALIADCGHHPHIEKPAETLNEIKTWMDSQFIEGNAIL